ncbi:MAG TPA: PRC-barrel domain containing protein [Lentzea sp.]
MLASDLLGQTVHDHEGRVLGRVADLLTGTDQAGRPRVVRVLVAPRRRGRLFGFERPGSQPPRILEMITRTLHRGMREVAWEDIDWSRATS